MLKEMIELEQKVALTKEKIDKLTAELESSKRKDKKLWLAAGFMYFVVLPAYYFWPEITAFITSLA